MCRYLNNLNQLGRYCGSYLKVAKSCSHISPQVQVCSISCTWFWYWYWYWVFLSVYVYVDVLNCGSISHTFGVLISGCILKHLNFKLDYIRHIHVYVEISDVDVGWRYLDGTQQMYSLVWLLTFSTCRWLICCRDEKQDERMRAGCATVCNSHTHTHTTHTHTHTHTQTTTRHPFVEHRLTTFNQGLIFQHTREYF